MVVEWLMYCNSVWWSYTWTPLSLLYRERLLEILHFIWFCTCTLHNDSQVESNLIFIKIGLKTWTAPFCIFVAVLLPRRHVRPSLKHKYDIKHVSYSSSESPSFVPVLKQCCLCMTPLILMQYELYINIFVVLILNALQSKVEVLNLRQTKPARSTL